MYFVGQSHIMNQLKEILPYLYETKEGMAILIRGPSGWGKTRMSWMICNYLANGKFDYCLGNNLKIKPGASVHFIDEVHLLVNPEVLYPMIDSGKHVFVLATNDTALINEALVNRCTDFTFAEYTMEDLRQIARMSLKVPLEDDLVDYLIDCGGANPRIIKNIIKRLNIILFREPDFLKGFDLDMFKRIMETVFGIVDGLDVICQRYISSLVSLGGLASINTLATYLHVDKDTLQYHVEPILLYKNLIQISSRGRKIK